MNRSMPSRAVVITALILLAPPLAVAQSLKPTSHAATSWSTAASSVTLQGTTTAHAALANVHWVNQFGQRGRGTWVSSGAQTSHWTVTDVPLRAGVNLISVISTDVKNRSSSVAYAINRSTGVEQSLDIRSGFLQGRPIAYQLWNGHAVVEGDIILSESPATLAVAKRPLAAATSSGVHTDGLSIGYTSQL